MAQQTLVKRVLAGRTYRYVLVLVVFLLFVVGYQLTHTPPTEAATSSTINFQARLKQSSGAVVPDGYYNVQFKLYSASSGGSPLWTETYYDSNGVTAGNDNRIRVVNGYLSVSLGSLTAFGAQNWDQEMWITMNVGGVTQTASPSYDGEMSPRLKLTGVPYAFQAGKLAKRTGANTSTLDFATQTGARSILLPDESGTVCIQTSSNCGFATSSGSGNYIQNGVSPQTADFNITGNGTLGGNINVSGNVNVSGVVISTGASASSDAFRTKVSGDANSRLNIEADGTMWWGNGTSAYDTNFYRSAAGLLQTDGRFKAEHTATANSQAALAGVTNITTAVTAGFTFGTTGNVSINLSSGSQGVTYGLYGSTDWSGSGGTVSNLASVAARPTYSGASPGGTITNQYGFWARGINNNTSGTPTIAIQNAYGLYVENQNSSWITSPVGVYIEGQTSGVGLQFAAGTSVNAGIQWGSDTNLYRSAANTLKTDDALVVGGIAGVNSTSALQVQDVSGNSILNVDTTNGRVNIGYGVTSDDMLDVNGDVYVRGNLRLDDSTRQYTSDYSTTIVANTPTKIGEYNFAANSRNVIITGEIRGQNSASYGISRFVIGGRSNTLPSKNLTFSQDVTDNGRQIRVKLYEDTTTGRVVLAFVTNNDLMNVGWTVTVQERGNYDGFQNTTAYEVLDTTGLTERSMPPNYTQSWFGNAVFQNATESAAAFQIQNAAGTVLFNANTTGGTIDIGTASTGVLRLLNNSGTNTSGILFGSTQDTNLYRSAANTLQTDDSFVLNGTGSNLTVGGTLAVTGASSFTDNVTIGTSTAAAKLTVNGSGGVMSPLWSSLSIANPTLNTHSGGVIQNVAATGASSALGLHVDSISANGLNLSAVGLVASRISSPGYAAGLLIDTVSTTSSASPYPAVGADITNVTTNNTGNAYGLRIANVSNASANTGNIVSGITIENSISNVANTSNAYAFRSLSTAQSLFAGAVTVQGAGAFTGSGTGLSVTNNATVGGTLTVADAIESSVRVQVNNPNNTGAMVQLSWVNDIARLRYGGTGAGSANGFQIQGTGNAIKLSVGNNGNLGLGQADNTYRLSLPTSTVATGGIDFGGDTNLYRTGTDALRTDDALTAVGGLTFNPATATGTTLRSTVGSEANPRFNINYGGVISWGAGGGTVVDTNLYRSAANTLKTDDNFYVTQALTVVGINYTVGKVYAGGGTANEVQIGAIGPASEAGIRLGLAGDTTLYRSAASTLQTDGSFVLNGTGANLTVGGTLSVTGKSTQTGVIQEVTSPFKAYRNLAAYNASTGTSAGAFVIETNVPIASNTMTRTVIEGYFYDSTGPFRIEVGGYMRSTGDFLNRGYVNTGAKKVSVRFGSNAAGNGVIILGETTDTFPHPKLAVTYFLAGHSSLNDNYGDGWTISQKTDLSAYSNLTTVPETTSISDGSLSSNVALLNRNSQTFTGNNQLFKNASDSATAFQIQNAAGAALLTADTSSASLIVGTSSTGVLKLLNNSGTNTSGILFGSSGDVNLYRSAANILATDDGLLVNQPTTGIPGIDIMGFANNGVPVLRVTSGASPNTNIFAIRNSSLTETFTIAAGGSITQSGAASVTTGSGAVALNGNVTIASGKLLTLQGTGVTSGIQWSTDTNLYRSAANILKTDDALVVGGTAGVNSTSALQVQNASGNSILNVDTTNSRVSVGYGVTPDDMLDVNGDIFVRGNLRLDDSTRQYTSDYSDAIAGGTPIKIGEYNFTANSRNVMIIGEVRGQSSQTSGVSRFIISARSNTLPDKTFTFSQDVTDNGRPVRVKVYQDESSGRFVLAFVPNVSLHNVGWIITVQERGNYDAFQNTTAYEVLDTTGLTEVSLSPNYTQTWFGNGIFQNVTDSTAAFQIQNSAGTSLFTADTTNNRIVLGSGTSLVLGSSATAPSSPVNGQMYYDTTLNVFRFYQNGVWLTLDGTGGGSSTEAPRASAYSNSSQTIPDSAWTAVAFGAERYDTDNIHSLVTNTTRFTAQTSGVYDIKANIGITTSTLSSTYVSVRLNGSTYIATNYPYNAAGNITQTIPVSVSYELSAGDYVEVVIWQNSGSSATVPAAGSYYPQSFSMEKINGIGSGGAGSSVPYVRLSNSSAQSLSTTYNTLTFNTEAYDTDNMHSNASNPSRITFNTAGLYQVSYSVCTTTYTSGSNVYISADAILNGANGLGSTDSIPGNYGGVCASSSVTYRFNAGDYLTLQANNYTATAYDVNAYFSAVKLDGGLGGTLQGAYDSGNVLTTTNGRDIKINLSDNTTDANFIVNITPSSTGQFQIQANGTNTVTVNGTGQTLFKNSSNSATAFQIQNASGVTLLGVDTSNSRIFSTVANGASAIGFTLNTPSYTTAGAKLLSVRNNNVEKFSIDKDGNVSALNFSGNQFTAGSAAQYTADRISFSSGPYYVLNSSSVGVRLDNGATSWSSQSDLRLKDILEPMEGSVDKLNQIRSVIYRFKTDDSAVRRVGVIAQDVQAVLPEAVSVGDDGYLGVRYTELVPLTIAGIQELDQRTSALENGMLLQGGTADLSALNVSGPTTVASLHVTGEAIFDGDITVGGHIATTGDTPLGEILSAAGESYYDEATQQTVDAKIEILGNDTAGTIRITTSRTPTAGALAKILFNKPYAHAPRIVVSAANENAADLRYYRSNTSQNEFTFNAKNAPRPDTVYEFDYYIVDVLAQN